MSSVFLIVDVLLPILGGAVLTLFARERSGIRRYTGLVTLLASVLTWLLILRCPAETLTLVHFSDRLILQLHFDGLGHFFAGIVATLWPLTVLYAYEYMEDDRRQGTFFSFFTITYGVTLGVTMAGNIFTLYCFYELLTLVTVPLVMHTQTLEAARATRVYLFLSLGGAAFAFISMMYLIVSGGDIRPGATTQLFYLFGFFGFGVKAAVFPLYFWLPRASVAPTPVTALLHAVAVVKSGVFAITRLTWCCYGVEVIRGTSAQTVALCFVAFTIVFGSSMALKERHLKRRMALSTVANLSYILFGVLLLTETSLTAGLMHMAFHAEIKILAFFATGAIMHHSGREYLSEMDGLARRMPFTFIFFAVASLGLTGIPPFAGFISKWMLLSAAAEIGTTMAWVGSAALLISALLTAMYCFTALQRAVFPDRNADLSTLESVHEAGPAMLIPMGILAAAVLVTGLCAGAIQSQLAPIVAGLCRW